jgi:hypothetical protein
LRNLQPVIASRNIHHAKQGKEITFSAANACFQRSIQGMVRDRGGRPVVANIKTRCVPWWPAPGFFASAAVPYHAYLARFKKAKGCARFSDDSFGAVKPPIAAAYWIPKKLLAMVVRRQKCDLQKCDLYVWLTWGISLCCWCDSRIAYSPLTKTSLEGGTEAVMKNIRIP